MSSDYEVPEWLQDKMCAVCGEQAVMWVVDRVAQATRDSFVYIPACRQWYCAEHARYSRTLWYDV